MLKWLRKYNTFILVIGGCLLMVSFLIGSTLQDLTQRGIIGGKVMRVSGSKVTQEQYGQYGRQYRALAELLSRSTNGRVSGTQLLKETGGGENLDHFLMLVRQAENGGYVGGVEDGLTFIPTLAQYISQTAGAALGAQQAQIDQMAVTFQRNMEASLPAVQGDTGLNEEQVGRSLARLHGIMRMRAAYATAPRFSDSRLILGVKQIVDSADVDTVIFPAERFAGQIAEPTEAQLQAHFDRFKGVKKGQGDVGIGYTLPPRVKLEWLALERQGVSEIVVVDPVKVQELFLRKYPSGKPPEGTTADEARAKIEADVRKTETDRIMKAAEDAVRAELGRATGKLERDGEYRFLPPDWTAKRPRMADVGTAIIARVFESTGVRLPSPKVGIRETRWLDETELQSLPGIGQATLRRASLQDPFTKVVMGARELSPTGRNDTGLQVGVPLTESLTDFVGTRYFVTVLDVRKESPADSLEEVRADAAYDFKRLAAYEQLKGRVDTLRAKAVAEGLAAIAQPEPGATGEAANPLTVQKATVSKGALSSMAPEAAKLDHEAFRDPIIAAAGKLDPMKDPKTEPADGRTLASAIDKSLRVAVSQITAIKPLTAEQFRAFQSGMTSRLARDEIGISGPETDPFSLVSLEKRLGVEYLDGRDRSKKGQKDE
ncbi:MAG: hypothetical protein K2Q20_07000 [Phycisphaerales bacterium]|nr:hypothetical protein [Phycisphaerales bacterium]